MPDTHGIIEADSQPECLPEPEIIREIQSEANKPRVAMLAALAKDGLTEADAIGILIDDWIEQAGITVTPLADIRKAYRELRGEIATLPKISDDNRLGKLLAGHGCIPMVRDGRYYGGDGRRVRVFEMRPRKARRVS